MKGYGCVSVLTSDHEISAGGFTGNGKRWVPWKKDAGKKKAECDKVDEGRQDDGEKGQGMF